MKTREETDQLKQDWANRWQYDNAEQFNKLNPDRSFPREDVENTEGFEEYREELKTLRLDTLKKHWKYDPIWEIEDTEGYEEYREELLSWRKEYEQQENEKYEQKELEIFKNEKSEAEKLGLHGLYSIVNNLKKSIEMHYEAENYRIDGYNNDAYSSQNKSDNYLNSSTDYEIKRQNKYNQQLSQVNKYETENSKKIGYIQGVCECVVALGENHALGEKLFLKMQVTQDMAKKFANPETYKTLEQGIFAQKQEQKSEQKQGIKY